MSAAAQTGSVVGELRIAEGVDGVPAALYGPSDVFASSIAPIDLERDGRDELAVGVQGADGSRGGVWLLFFDSQGVVQDTAFVGGGTGPDSLAVGDSFGAAVVSLGDLDGDGVPELAVGANGDDDGGGPQAGAVWILFMNIDGTVKSRSKISNSSGMGNQLGGNDSFGVSLGVLGDLGGDGTVELAVGSFMPSTPGGTGAVWIVSINSTGAVADTLRIANGKGGFTGPLLAGDEFGISLAVTPDIDGNGVRDLIVGADGDDDGGDRHGAAWVLLLQSDGSVIGEQKINELNGNFGGTLDPIAAFGRAVGSLGDLDGDGTPEVVVSASYMNDGGTEKGAFWILSLDSSGSVVGELKIAEGLGGFVGPLDVGGRFGSSMSAVNIPPYQLAVGAHLATPSEAWLLDLQEPWEDVANADLADGGSGSGVSWADFDADGDLDLYLAKSGGQSNRLFRNDAGSFVDATPSPLAVGGRSQATSWGDHDNDGDLDLYVSNSGPGGGNPGVPDPLLRNDGGGSFADVTVAFGLGSTDYGTTASWVDYDNDGDIDLFLGNQGQADVLYRNDGAPPFIEEPAGSLQDPGDAETGAWGDYDDDGDLDLYLTVRSGTSRLYRNDGGGSFTDVTPAVAMAAGLGCEWVDFDDDGDLDLFVATWTNPNLLLRNDPGGFVDATPTSLPTIPGGDGAWGDFDNDGDLDLYLVRSYQQNTLARNDANGNFTDVTPAVLADVGDGTGAAWGDYDDDGDLDLYISNTNPSNPNKLFRNDLSNGNHWLHVDLEGTVSNRAAVGARVTAVAGGRRQIREVTGGSRSQDSYTVEFGLGAVTDVDSLTIRWPSGIVQQFEGIAADQKIVVTEPPQFIAAGLSEEYFNYGSVYQPIYQLNGGINWPGAWSGYSTGPQYDPAAGLSYSAIGYSNAGNDPGQGGAVHLTVQEINRAFPTPLRGTAWASALGTLGGPSGNRGFWIGESGVQLNHFIFGIGQSARAEIETPDTTVVGGAVVDDNAVHLLLGKVQVDYDVQNHDRVSVWIDPPDLTSGEPGLGPANVVLDGVDFEQGTGWVYTTLQISNQSKVDALRYSYGTAPSDSLLGLVLGTPAWAAVTAAPLGDTGVGSGVAWGDYDDDGDLDLYLANGGANRLFRNDGGGSFADATHGPLGDTNNGGGVAFGDVDDDGDLDLYLANIGSANKLFRNDGAVFVDATVAPLDDAGSGHGVAFADVDGDGDLDVYLANYGQANKLFRNDGGGAFADATAPPLDDAGNGTGVVFGDLDEDGDPDVYLANYAGVNRLFRNDGGGSFADATAGPLGDTSNGRGVALADVDGDGDMDIYLANDAGQPNKLFRNDGGGTFVDATTGLLADSGSGIGVAFGDVDNDGDPDLYLANDAGANRLLRNDGNGTFADATIDPLGDTSGGRGLAFGDADADGDLDLYVANIDAANVLLRNDEAAAFNHWLHLDLTGTISNRSGVGARARIVTAAGSQVAEVSSGSGYLSQNSLAVEFGLGAATTVDSLTIRWPSGILQTLAGASAPSVDQLLPLTEPSPQISSVQPAGAPNTGVATFDVAGNILASRIVSATLTRTFESPRSASSVVVADSLTAQLQFDLLDAAPGAWDLEVSTPLLTATLPGAVFIYSVGAPILCDSIPFVGAVEKIANPQGGLPAPQAENDWFGKSVTAVGDLDGNGVGDIVVGAHGVDSPPGNGNDFGALWVLFLNASGGVDSTAQIGEGFGGLPSGLLAATDHFGTAVASLGDLEGDGTVEIAVGAQNDGSNVGSVTILSLSGDGTVTNAVKIENGVSGFPDSLLAGDEFGASAANIGDLDQNGTPDLAVGANSADGTKGAVWILFLNSVGWVDSASVIGDGSGGISLQSGDFFGSGIARLGDLDNNGTLEIAVGAQEDDGDGGPTGPTANQGAVWILSLDAGGSVVSQHKITSGQSGFPSGLLTGQERFGASVTSVGDLNGNGVPDLAVGATTDEPDSTRLDLGSLWLVFLDSAGLVDSVTTIGESSGGFPSGLLDDEDWFGSSVAAIGDVNADGVVELAVGARQDDDGSLNAGALWILYLDRCPDWTDVTVDSLGVADTRAAAWVDYDGDDDLDLYVARRSPLPNKVLRNDGGTFADVAVPPLNDSGNTQSNGWADYDNDGDPDLYIGQSAQANLLLRNDGGGAFADATNGSPLNDAGNATSIAWADYDRDGDVDIFLGDQGQPDKILRNEGDGVIFDIALGLLSGNDFTNYGVWGDYDGDGDPDLFRSVGGTNSYTLFRNDGGDSFSNVTSLLPSDAGADEGAVWVDFDNDRDLDLYVASAKTSNGALFRNDGSAFVNVATGVLADTSISRSSWADFDNDGDLDAYLVPFFGTKRLARNDGSGIFVDVTPGVLDYGGNGTAAISADYDGDGDPDLYTCNADATPNKLFRNDIANGNHWLHVELAGTKSNRDGIGARVTAVTGALGQIREVSGGSREQESLPVEFGLGAATTVDSLVIRWPSAIVQTLTDVAVDQLLHVTEPICGSADWANGVLVQKLSSDSGGVGIPGLAEFGGSLAVGDVDCDGVTDLVAGFPLTSEIWIILLNDDGTVKAERSIGNAQIPQVGGNDRFGRSLAFLGDLDGNGPAASAVAVGTPGVDSNAGGFWVVFLDGVGGFVSAQQVLSGVGGLAPGSVNLLDELGTSIAPVGDLDGDGVTDIVVGAPQDDDGPLDSGSLFVLFLQTDGTVKAQHKISANSGDSIGTLVGADFFGTSLAFLGDLDGAGPAVATLAVGMQDDGAGTDRGAVCIASLDSSGTSIAHQRISDFDGGFTGVLNDYDAFGNSVAPMPDLDGDGVAELAVGSPSDNQAAMDAGAVWILHLNTDGTVKSFEKIALASACFPDSLDASDSFGVELASPGIADGNGVAYLAVGAPGDDDGGAGRGAVWQLFLSDTWTPCLAPPFAAIPAGAATTDSSRSQGVAVADYDGDGNEDIFVSTTDTGGRLFRNQGGMAFSEITVSAPSDLPDDPRGAIWGDPDYDGDLDLYVLQWNGANKLFQNSGGAFADSVIGTEDGGRGHSGAWLDSDGDGDLDLYVLNSLTGATGTSTLYRNDGSSFAALTTVPNEDREGRGVACSDFDRDGDQDIFLTNDVGGTGYGNRLMRNDGGNQFAEVTAGPLVDSHWSQGCEWADLDNDGLMDLVFANYDSLYSVFRNDGAGTFSEITLPAFEGLDGFNTGLVAEDFDNDGDVDLYVGREPGSDVMLRNDGGFSFSQIELLGQVAEVDSTVGIAAADFDLDGDVDIYTAVANGSNRLLRNDWTAGRHWLHLDLDGAGRNRFGVGAWIEAVTGGIRQHREVRAGSGLYSMSSMTAMFGLGAATTVDTVLVRWPSGIVQHLENVAADQRLTIQEPAAAISWVTPSAVADTVVQVDVVGTFLSSGISSATLFTDTDTVAANVTQVDPVTVSLGFDLTGKSGAWNLAVASPLAADTLTNAIVVYGETGVALARSTSSPADDATPTVSPAGSLAFVSARTGGDKLYVKDLDAPDAGSLVALGDTTEVSASPSWSPAATEIAVDQNGTIYRIDPSNPPARTQVTSGPDDREPAWSPLADRIAFTRLNGAVTELFVVDSSGTSETRLTSPVSTSDTEPSWSSDGARLAFGRASEILAVSATAGDSAGLDTLTSSPGFVSTDPAWSPDGRWIAFASDRDTTGGSDLDIYVMDSRGEAFGLLPITTDGGDDHDPAWTADGRLTFSSDRSNGVSDVFVASTLPTTADEDGDLVVDALDACLGAKIGIGEIDRDFNGCADSTSSLRSIRFWPQDRFPVTYQVNAGADPRIPDPSDYDAIRFAFQEWDSLPDSRLPFSEDTTAGPDVTVAGDGRNSISFKDPMATLPGILAIAVVTSCERDTVIDGRWFTPGEIVDADVLFNQSLFSFSTDAYAGPPGAFDLQSIATHEVGHVFGFAHSISDSSTMYYVIPRNTSARSLSRDDEAVARRLYSTSAPTLSVAGRVFRDSLGTPVKAAAVLAQADTSLVTTLAMTLTDTNGEYRFYDVPEPFRVYVLPIDGSAAVGFMRPGDINSLVDSLSLAEPPFVPEYYDTLDSATDSGMGTTILPGLSETGADIILNADLSPPQVLSITPDSSTVVPPTTVVTTVFNERIRSDSTSLNGSTLRLFSSSGGVPGFAGVVQESILVFTPDAPLVYDTTYTFTVGPGILDLFDNAMPDSVSVQFTVEDEPTPMITSISPRYVPVGGVLAIAGAGFDPDTSVIDVTFETAGAPVTQSPFASTYAEIFVDVPAGAVTGQITVDRIGAPSATDSIVIAPAKQLPASNLVDTLSVGGDIRKVALRTDGGLLYVATSVGVTAVDVDPAGGFGAMNSLPMGGGCPGVVTLPDGFRAVALGASPPVLQAFDDMGGGASSVAHSDTSGLSLAPLGIAALPGGGSVLVVHEDRVARHDARPGGSFGVLLGETRITGDTFLGDVSVSPSSREAFASTGSGRIAVIGLAPEDSMKIVRTLAGGTLPRETAATPDAARFLSVDEAGTVALHETRGSTIHEAAFSGGFTGLAVSPEGDFAYATNFILNTVQVLDLRGNNILDAGDFGTAVDPRDVVVGTEGRYVYVAATHRLDAYDTTVGPRIDTVLPQSGGEGTLITIAGSGFSPSAAEDSVFLGGTLLPTVRVDAAGQTLVVSQPSGAPSGALVVSVSDTTSPGFHYDAVNRTDPGAFDSIRKFGTGATAPREMVASPDGDRLFVLHADGTLSVIEADPRDVDPIRAASDPSRFLRPLQILSPTETLLAGSGPMAVTADGAKLYVADPSAGRVRAYTFDAADSLVWHADVVDIGGGTNLSPRDIALTRDGRRLLVTGAGRIYEVSTTSDTTLAEGTPFGAPDRIEIHPENTRAYVTDGTDVRILDIDPDSPGHLTEIGTSFSVNGVADSVRLLATADGEQLFAYSRLPGTSTYQAAVLDVRDSLASLGTFPIGTGAASPVLTMNRSDALLFVSDPNAMKQSVYDRAAGVPVLRSEQILSTALFGVASVVLSHDDARLYAVASGDSVLVTNLTSASSLVFQSGTGQIGAVNEALPAPLVASVSDVAQNAVPGALVLFTTPDPGAGFGFPDGRLYTAADRQGMVRARFVSGPVPGVATIEAKVGTSSFGTTLNVVDDGDSIPPQIIAMQPDSGTVSSVVTSFGADFSKRIARPTATAASFRVHAQGDPVSVPGKLSFANDDRRIVFTPDVALADSTTYVFEITSAIEDSTGNALSNPDSVQFDTPAPPTQVSLRSVHPASGAPGARVTLVGKGFARVPTDNLVRFGTKGASVLTGSPDVLQTIVPADSGGITTIVVTANGGSASLPFEVLVPATNPGFRPANTTGIPSSGQEIAVLPDSRAYIAMSGANAVVPLLFVPIPFVEPVVPVGLHPFGITGSPKGDRVYVTNYFSNNVSVLDADSGSTTFQRVLFSIPTGTNPTGIAVHPDGRSLYVVNYGDSTLTIIDADSTHATFGTVRASTNAGSASKTVVITPDGGGVYLGTSYGLLSVDPVTGEILEQIELGISTQSIAALPVGGFLLVLSTDGELLLVDISPGNSGVVRASTNTGGSSKTVVVTPDGGLAFVASGTDLVSVFAILLQIGSGAAADSSQFQLVPKSALHVGENVHGLAFDPKRPSRLLVTNAGAKTVSIYDVLRSVGSTAVPEISLLPTRFELYANYPNPFRIGTTIRYDIPKQTFVDIKIYNVMGRLVRTLESHAPRDPGRYQAIWDSRNNSGGRVASGVYFYRLETGDFRKARKMVLLR